MRRTFLLVALLAGLAGCDLFVGADARVERAEALLAEGAYSEALVELKNAVDKDPNNPRAQFALARAQLQLGQFDAADKALAQARTSGTEAAQADALHAEILLARGAAAELLTLLDGGKFAADAQRQRELRARALAGARRCEESMVLARELLAADPDNSRLSITLAECLLARGNLAGARAELEAAQKANDEDAEVRMALARVNQLSGRSDEAFADWQKAAQLAAGRLTLPQQVVLYSALADQQVARLDLAGLRKTRDAVLGAVPGSALAEYLGANVALLEGKPDVAASTVQKLLASDQNFHAGRALLGSALLAQGNLEQARQQIGTLSGNLPGSASFRLANKMVIGLQASASQTENYWLGVAGIHGALGQPMMARSALERAAEIAPGSRQVELSQGRLDLRTGNVKGAQDRANKLRAKYPDDPVVLVFFADANKAGGDFGAVMQALETLGKTTPSAALAMSMYEARRNAKLANPSQPLADWLAAHPDDSAVRRLHAEALTLQGDHAAAAREYEKVLTTQPGEVGTLNNLAWIYHLQRDPRALETSRRAWQAAPKVPEVADTHGWLLVESGAVKEGLAILQEADAAAGARQPEIRYHYASALARAGNRQEAARLLQDLLVNGGSFPSREQAEALRRSLTG